MAIFLTVLVVILFTPLFKRIKVPPLVAMILAGVTIGPYGLNLLERDASFQIFGQVGILYLMFMAAIEINMYHLQQNLRSGVIYGLITFLLPFGLGLAVMRLLFGTGWDTAVLVASMFSSHTLVSYPTVSKFGLSTDRGVVVAVCGTIVAVLLSLIALAEVVDVKLHGAINVMGILRLMALMTAYALVVGFTFPYITRRYFRKVNNPVQQFIYMMAMVFVASLAAQLIGLEAILGAFYAGLVLNRFIPNRSPLMTHISFVGNAVFIPYFLIGVGMLINVHVVFTGWSVVYTAAVMTATALVAKWIGAWTSARMYKLQPDQRRIMFGLSSGKAAATIAATMIGYQYGLINEDMMNGAVIMILVCCIVASVCTERAALRIRMNIQQEELDTEGVHSPDFARQVVAVANPMTAERLMKIAIFMRSPSNRQPLTALHVRSTDDARSRAFGRQSLAAAHAAAMTMDVEVEEVERFDHNIRAGLVATMTERRATEIVIGLHGRASVADSIFGNLSDQLVADTDRMIIMVRCFIPIDTVRKIVVMVPRNAELESGFQNWVARISNLAQQLSCRVVFVAYESTQKYLEACIEHEEYNFNHEYRTMESWDDFIILTSQAGVEDLLVVVGARRGSISASSDWDDVPDFLDRHFRSNNIALIYPSQFGAG